MKESVELISLLGSPWTAKALWILDLCGINVHRRPFEPFADEIWLRYKLSIWPWDPRFWSRFTVPIAILRDNQKESETQSGILLDSLDIAKWALKRSAPEETQRVWPELQRWNALSDVLLNFGRAHFAKVATRDVRVAIEVLSPPWMKKLPAFLVRFIMKIGVAVFAFKYRRENQCNLDAVLAAVQEIRAALQKGKGKYLMGDRFSYADIVMAIAVNGLAPSKDVFQFTVPSKYEAEPFNVLSDFNDVKVWKNAIVKEHLPQILRVPSASED